MDKFFGILSTSEDQTMPLENEVMHVATKQDEEPVIDHLIPTYLLKILLLPLIFFCFTRFNK